MISGITGQFFRQFTAVTIAAATVISAFVSLTLVSSPCARSPEAAARRACDAKRSILARGRDVFFGGFNAMFDRLSLGYGHLTRRLLRVSALVLVAYVALLGLTGGSSLRSGEGLPSGAMDQGYFITAVQLPPGSSLSRTDEVMKKVSARLMEVEGIVHVVAIAGLDGATFTGSSNTVSFSRSSRPMRDRAERHLDVDRIIASLPALLADDVSERASSPINRPLSVA